MKLKLTALFIGLLAIIFALLPWLFVQVADWQKAFNQLISENLHQIQAHSSTAGLWLIFAAFSYGVLHALGPGHGKFIIASYLSTHESQLKTSVRLSLLSSLMQGFVAVAATSIVVVILNLSSKYFKLSQLWLERSALILLLLLGLYWIAQGLKGLKKNNLFVSHRFNHYRNRLEQLRHLDMSQEKQAKRNVVVDINIYPIINSLSNRVI